MIIIINYSHHDLNDYCHKLSLLQTQHKKIMIKSFNVIVAKTRNRAENIDLLNMINVTQFALYCRKNS